MSSSTELDDYGTDPAPVVKAKGPAFHKVKLTHPNHHARVVFRSVSETRARQWLENHCPRGSEMYLELADGTILHHEAERVGEKGADADKWQPFDPESWVAPEASVPPGQDEWSDKEG